MQKPRILHFLLVTVLLIPLVGAAQPVITTNEKGEKIKVYPDGHMEYFNGDPIETADGQQATYPIFKGYIEPLDGAINVNQEDLYHIAQRRAQLSNTAAELAAQRVQEAEDNLSRLQARWSEVGDNEHQRNILQKQLAAAQRTLNISREQWRESQSTAVTDQELVAKGGFVEAFNRNRNESRRSANRSAAIRAAADASYASLIPLTDNSAATSFEDVLRRPPRRVCQLAFEGQDEEMNQLRRDLVPEPLFSYTDERLRPYLQDREYLRCEAYLSSVGGYRYLTLDFTFAYPNAREAYGFIDHRSILTLKMLNGEFVNLQAGTLDRGVYDTVKQELRYSVYYPIDRSIIGTLKASELDLVRVFWSNGFEEYPVRQMDFFQRQFACLGD
ncbi:MAG: hypothetical protein AAGJ82_10740 [Bacteroidota bacterium]